MLNWIDEWKSDWNYLSATKAQRYTALLMSGIAALIWALRGWDSGIGTYGTSLHFSVFVVYGIEFAVLNWNLDVVENIRGIRNLIISVLWTVFSVSIFEWYWGLGYALYHDAVWVLTPLNNVYTELIAITLIGALGGIYAIKIGVHPKIDYITLLLLTPAIFWLAIGFPQTCYPLSDGKVIYIENNMIHLFNVLAKFGMAFGVANILMHKRPHEMSIQFLAGSLCAIVESLIQKLRYVLQILFILLTKRT